MNTSLIIDILIEKTNACLIVLFGSAAQNNLRADSDIDIAFLAEKKLTGYDVFCIAQELAEKFNRDIDLIDLSKASTVLKAQILGKGKIIYFNDENMKANFEIRTFKEYCLLNEERKVILDKIAERGSVYGERCDN